MDTQIAETIAGQLHSMKPDHLIPGKDVGMVAIDKGVIVSMASRIVTIVLDEAADLYGVTIDEEDSPTRVFDGIFCDQLGELVWGDDAKPWNLPFGGIIDMETGETIAEW
jgi:hypothetical protein